MLVGHSPFLSRNTVDDEKLPIAVPILGSPGTLFIIISSALANLALLAHPLAQAGISSCLTLPPTA